MAESAISFLLNELSELLKEERRLLGGLGQDVEFIHGKLAEMRAFLRVADSKEEIDPLLKEWVRKMREIAYDIEDVLDSYMLRFAQRDAHGFRGCLKQTYASMKSLKARHQIASEIKTIKCKIENASENHKTFTEKYPLTLLESSSGHSMKTSYDGRGDALLLEDTEIVGIEKPKQQLLEWLSATDYGLKAISVVGMPGLGKTTLVKKVYDDASLVEMNFDNRVWITVSESFKTEVVLEDIIKQLMKQVKQPLPPELEAMNDNDRREFIFKFLQNKNYIIVLDDVWRIDAWEAVRYAFPRSTTSGRGCIIITSRFSSIGNAACSETNGHVCNLKPLPREKSKSLLYIKAFPGSYSCPPHLEEISENILSRCEGWPLAIVVIGGLLATKNNRFEEWEMFNRCLGSEIVGDDLKRMSNLLSLSFYDLPYYLKTCFLYLSIFSEDEVIEKATIIRLWIAEGFVEAKQGKTMTEMAEGYLNELVNRSLIQVVETNVDGGSRNFRIHDLVREYVISKARDQDIAVVYSGGEMQWSDRIRRLALHNSINFTQEVYRFEHLHSLLLLGAVDSGWLPMLYKVLHGGCRMLKVLDLRGAPLDTILNEIFKLYHLKYLSLRDTQVKVIPKSIGNLRKLETLDLKRTMVTELPIEILKLGRLRNLLVYLYKVSSGYLPFDNVRSFKAPYEIGQLVQLQKLCYIDADDIKIVREIGKLSQLQRLGITKLRREDGRELCTSLTKLTSLRSLSITAFEEEELIDMDYSDLSPFTFPFLRRLELFGCLQKVPQWIPSLNALTTISLLWSRLWEDPLECLERLPNLQCIFMECAFEGQELSFRSGGFQRLKKLHLKRMRGLRWMRAEKGSMPLLQHLEVADCKSMVEVPVGIEHLTNLEFVSFVDMAEEFVERVLNEKREQGDHWNFAHIPYFRVLCGGCRMLKVMELERAPLDTVPTEVFKLYHLKYLKPKGYTSQGHSKINRKLETLDLKRTMVTELPIAILKLQSLFGHVQSFLPPYEKERLVYLQKLCYIDA